MKNIKMMKLSAIKPYANNPRKNDAAVEKVAASIEEFGFLVPILLDKDSVIVAGHTRYKAAEKLGIDKVPCIVLDDLSEDDIRQYRIIDNKTSELSSWDYGLLTAELGEITELNMGAFGLEKFFEEPGEEVELPEVNLDEGKELDLSDFEDEAFENECPWCGFRW